ncbi:YaaC family protein [Bacillus sp. YC2]|uniref:YaaC family protein n=1 Tax=Bacillus sp. YC2 TaxID=2861287 RepID=UPI001CA5F474|nr:YaaC family protein [Bacillus sp. YC2]MBY8914890.1 YaaC family protein [Bacillus sp. YC2]
MRDLEWKELALFYSVESSQKFLNKVYTKRGIEEPKRYAFKNSERFIFFIKHAESFYKQASLSPLEIKPILLFYGMSQLLKACLITTDPSYPSHASVLAHGVTARKRKKQNYCFREDEVKIQRNGLCIHVMKHLFGMSGLEEERYTMKKLLTAIPELRSVFYFQERKHWITKVELNDNFISVPEHAVIHYNMSDSRFAEYMNHHLNWSFQRRDKDRLVFHIDQKDSEPWSSPNLLFHLEKNEYYIPAQRDQFLHLPEMIIHYLVLYNVGMIARYETEWWYELLTQHVSDDYVIIRQFLEVTERKFPYYVFNFLEQFL